MRWLLLAIPTGAVLVFWLLAALGVTRRWRYPVGTAFLFVWLISLVVPLVIVLLEEGLGSILKIVPSRELRGAAMWLFAMAIPLAPAAFVFRWADAPVLVRISLALLCGVAAVLVFPFGLLLGRCLSGLGCL